MACSPREGIQGDRVYAVTVMNPDIVGGKETTIAVPAWPVTAATSEPSNRPESRSCATVTWALLRSHNLFHLL